MLLNERRVLYRILDGSLVISPILNLAKQLGPTSFDIRLGTEFKIARSTRFAYIDPRNPKEKIQKDVKRFTEEVRIGAEEAFVLHPGEFALGVTLEYIRLPHDLAGRLEGRSSWGRLGLQVHATAGFVDPGFEGNLTFELNNVGRVPIALFAGTRIAQLSFYECGEVLVAYEERAESKYLKEIGATDSRLFDDYEFENIRQREARKAGRA